MSVFANPTLGLEFWADDGYIDYNEAREIRDHIHTLFPGPEGTQLTRKLGGALFAISETVDMRNQFTAKHNSFANLHHFSNLVRYTAHYINVVTTTDIPLSEELLREIRSETLETLFASVGQDMSFLRRMAEVRRRFAEITEVLPDHFVHGDMMDANRANELLLSIKDSHSRGFIRDTISLIAGMVDPDLQRRFMHDSRTWIGEFDTFLDFEDRLYRNFGAILTSVLRSRGLNPRMFRYPRSARDYYALLPFT